MTAVALRALWSRKLRTLLTAFAIVLGVATVCGTYVLTDSIKNAFNSIFQTVYRNTDATITGRNAIDTGANDAGGGQSTTPSFNQALLAKVRALPDVKDAIDVLERPPPDDDGDEFPGSVIVGTNCCSSTSVQSMIARAVVSRSAICPSLSGEPQIFHGGSS